MSPERRPERAAGGVVLRDSGGGLEVLVVHRPGHDDWSLPKGKLEAGESDEACALREVAEETGFRCELGLFLGEVSYFLPSGRMKIVRYFVMRPLDGTFKANDEVDEVAWLPLREAGATLTYAAERDLLEDATRPVLLSPAASSPPKTL